MELALTILAVALIGMVCGMAIYIVYIRVPHKVPGLKKIDEINKLLPGANCGACGMAGCFAFAQHLVRNQALTDEASCPILLSDPQAVKQLEIALGIEIDADAMTRKALLHCKGKSEVVYDYSGVQTCKAASLVSMGFKSCPFACLGLGDCYKACKYDAIRFDREKGIVVIDYVKCTGCALCVKECPQGLIEMVGGKTKIALRCNYNELRPIPGRERCDSACIHCRKCFAACKYDAIIWNKEKAIPEIDSVKCTLCGDCVAICPNNTLEFFRPGDEAKARVGVGATSGETPEVNPEPGSSDNA